MRDVDYKNSIPSCSDQNEGTIGSFVLDLSYSFRKSLHFLGDRGREKKGSRKDSLRVVNKFREREAKSKLDLMTFQIDKNIHSMPSYIEIQ